MVLALRTVSQITGMGFSSTSGVVNVRFACPKGFVETEGRVVSDTEVSFLTPSFEKFGPMQVRPASYVRGTRWCFALLIRGFATESTQTRLIIRSLWDSGILLSVTSAKKVCPSTNDILDSLRK